MCACLSSAPYWDLACPLTGNPTGDPLVCRQVLHPLRHTSQGWKWIFLKWMC